MQHRLGNKASFWTSAAVVAHTLWTSAAPSMTYPLYVAQWHLTTTVTAALFAIYSIVVVTVLIAFGTLSDHIGHRAAMLAGLGASIAGVLLFALAADVPTLFVGRILMGVGVGLSAGPSTAAVAAFAGAGQAKRTGSITAAAQALGMAAALIVGGGLVQYAPWPAHLTFWVLAGLLVPLFAVSWFLPGRVAGRPAGRWKPRLPRVESAYRSAFVTAALAVSAAYAQAGVVMSLGAQVAHDLVNSPNALVNGAALSLLAIAMGAVSLMARGLGVRTAMAVGAIASAVGAAFLAGAIAWQSLALFLAASASVGAGYSMLFVGGLGLINMTVPEGQRGGALSAVYLAAYLSIGVLSVALGRIATLFGLNTATDIGAAAMALLSGLTVLRLLAAPSIRVETAPKDQVATPFKNEMG
jgi:MFS family permease